MTVPGTSLRFEDPLALPLVLAFLAGALLVAWRGRRNRGGVLFPSLALVPAVRPSLSVRLRWVLVALRVVAATLLIVALARPQLGHATVEIVEQGIDIVLAVDMSSSMTAADFGGGRTRFDGTRSVLRNFILELKEHRVGVVIFAGEAMVLSPLSLDRPAVLKLVEPLEPGRPLRDGTAIGTGLATATNVLRDSRAASRVVILLTDGENNTGEVQPLDAANIARILGIRVYTVGAVPARSSEVDVELMRRISEMNGGKFYRANDEAALLEVYREIEHLERTRVGVRRSTEYEDAYLPFLAAGVVLVLIELLLGASVFRRAP
ncbi:MAG TPA: VWA domain-containing protein [Candidatus Limnocylindria bacterium]|nr:VWA domain-containing protein [Candidatus Limnocylindria bacterium]